MAAGQLFRAFPARLPGAGHPLRRRLLAACSASERLYGERTGGRARAVDGLRGGKAAGLQLHGAASVRRGGGLRTPNELFRNARSVLFRPRPARTAAAARPDAQQECAPSTRQAGAQARPAAGGAQAYRRPGVAAENRRADHGKSVPHPKRRRNAELRGLLC